MKSLTPPPGFDYQPDFISGEEEEELLAAIEPLVFNEVEMRGVVAKRTVIHYGWDYRYDEWTIEPTEPIPPFLEPLRERVADRMALTADDLAEVLLSRYPPTAGIGWHRDAPMFGPAVAGVSLASRCVMRFRRKAGDGFETWSAELEPRSLYILSGPARSQWQHTIANTPELRYSITFRTLRPKK